MSALIWWLFPISATVIAVLWATLRARPEKPTEATKGIAREVKAGRLDPETIDEKTIAAHLYTHDVPDPDLLIRTSGEMRVSNFMLWQISYAEIHVTPVLWPDFGRKEFAAALEDFAKRDRRFGGI